MASVASEISPIAASLEGAVDPCGAWPNAWSNAKGILQRPSTSGHNNMLHPLVPR